MGKGSGLHILIEELARINPDQIELVVLGHEIATGCCSCGYVDLQMKVLCSRSAVGEPKIQHVATCCLSIILSEVAGCLM